MSEVILTTEERARRTKAMWDAMTPDQKEEHRAKMRDGWAKRRANKKKAVADRKRRIGEATRQKWASLNSEEKAELIEKQQAGRRRTLLIRRGVKCGLGRNDLEELYAEHGEEELQTVVEWAEGSGIVETPTAVKAKPKAKPKAKRDPVSLLDAIRTVTCRSDRELIDAFTQQVSKKVNISVSFYQAIEHYVREENERARG